MRHRELPTRHTLRACDTLVSCTMTHIQTKRSVKTRAVSIISGIRDVRIRAGIKSDIYESICIITYVCTFARNAHDFSTSDEIAGLYYCDR